MSPLRSAFSCFLLTFLALGRAGMASDSLPSIRAWQEGDVQQLEVLLPGPLEDCLLLPGEPPLLLVADANDPDQGPRRIFTFDSTGEGSLDELVRDLPAEIDRLLALESGAEASSLLERVLAKSKEALFRINSRPGEPAHLVSMSLSLAYQQGTRTSKVLESGAGARSHRIEDPDRVLARIRPGRLDLYRVAEQDLALEKTLTIPVRARRDRRSLFLESPPVTELRSQDGQEVYAIGPEAHGNRRLRTILLSPQPEELEELEESWSLLPGPETVEESWYGWKDGKPILVVTTFSSDKIGIFERHRLRVYSLGADRTRGGRRPLLESTTASRRWQEVAPMILDADGDGRDDLIVFQTEGMGNGKLIFEAFLGAPGNGFQLTSRRTLLDTQPSRWSYGSDLTGDGVADLVTLDEGQLKVFAGTGGRRGRHLVERKASNSITVGTGDEKGKRVIEIEVDEGETDTPSRLSGKVRFLEVEDLDGDGVGEVLLFSQKRGGSQSKAESPRGILRVVRFRS